MIMLRLTNEQAEYLKGKMEGTLSDYHWTSRVSPDEAEHARTILNKIEAEWKKDRW